MFHDFSSDFTGKDTSFINLNNGTLGLCPDTVIRSQIREIQTFEHNTTANLGQAWKRLWKVQESLAQFIGASPQDLFLRPNITLVLNEMILGLNLPPGSEILSGNFEYGAIINILKLKAQKENHSLKLMDMSYLLDETTDEDFVVDQMIKSLTAKTKLVMLSHVLTGNGICLPITKIGKALRERDIFFIVDGAHGPGCFDLQINQNYQDIDFYSGNLHKWVMGPKGTAFGWVHPRLQNQTTPLLGSWTTGDNAGSSHLQFSPIGSFALKMLWSHSQEFASFYGLEECFNYWNSHSKAKIYGEIWARAQYLEAQLELIGLRPLKNTKNPLGSPLLSYNLKDFDENAFQQNMIALPGQKKLQVGRPHVPGFATIRLTAHIHNTKAELDSALNTFKQILKR